MNEDCFSNLLTLLNNLFVQETCILITFKIVDGKLFYEYTLGNGNLESYEIDTNLENICQRLYECIFQRFDQYVYPIVEKEDDELIHYTLGLGPDIYINFPVDDQKWALERMLEEDPGYSGGTRGK